MKNQVNKSLSIDANDLKKMFAESTSVKKMREESAQLIKKVKLPV